MILNIRFERCNERNRKFNEVLCEKKYDVYIYFSACESQTTWYLIFILTQKCTVFKRDVNFTRLD